MQLRIAQILATFLILPLCVSCNGEGGTPGSSSSGGGSGEFVKLNGAGASFPAPLYERWFSSYTQDHDDVQVDYQSVGSGSGVKAVIDGTVDFGASDAAMNDEEMAQVAKGVQLIPMTAGAIVLAYNLEGVEGLKLSRDAYTKIFLGEITKWNDPAIAASNEGVELPDEDIHVVVRSDSSGTTYVFTQHLAEISADFKDKVGVSKAPSWPVGVGSKGNEGITSSLSTTPGSIGYIEYGYAKLQKLAMAHLENKKGDYIEPTIESFQASMDSVEMPESLIAWMPDPEGAKSYPIVTYTWLILYKEYPAAKLEAMKDVVIYGLTEGQKVSEEMGYIPLPESVVEKGKAALDHVKAAAAAEEKPAA